MSSEGYSGVVAPLPRQLQQQPSHNNNSMHLPAFTGGDGSGGVYKPLAIVTSSPYPTASGNGDAVSAAALPPQMNMNMGMSVMPVSSSGGEPAKRKRGRPRKYGPDVTVSLGITSPTSAAVPFITQSPGAFSPPPPPSQPHQPQQQQQGPVSGGPVSPSSSKKARGRPPGSGKKHQLDAFGSSGFGFTPHVITVKAGEDVASKIMALSQHGTRAVCILSANGAISNVTLRQPATSGGSVTYEGRFEILSLSGSFLLTETGGQRIRSGSLSVSLAGPDGRVLGGAVAGLLIAASPVQVIVGSFVADGRKDSQSSKQIEHLEHLAPPKLSPAGGVTGGSPQSHGTYSESSGGPGSPLNQSNNSNPHGISGIQWK